MANLTNKPKDFTLKDNTATKVVKADLADKIEVEIGDAKDVDFKPQFKIKRWDNECNFSLRAAEDATATTVVENDVIKYKAKDYEVHQYEKPIASEDGGFEFEWVLPKKTKNNVFTATIETKELNFFYQPALTQEEKDQGAERPDNIVGSYAVYHKTKKNNKVGGKEYKCGKAFHIYRPKAVDNKGDEVWCELNIDEVKKELTVTVDDTWLKKAHYPVVIDPTFGYSSEGASSAQFVRRYYFNTYQTYRVGDGRVMSEDGTVDSVSAYLKSTVSETVDVQYLINEVDSEGTNSHGEIASHEELNMAITTSFTDKTITFSDESLSNATTYVISVVGDPYDIGIYNGWRYVYVAYDTGGHPDPMRFLTVYSGSSVYADSKEDPWIDTPTTTDIEYSIYATYTASGGAARRVFNIS